MSISGIIALWSGSIASIPAGWILCNGAGGSPDLRNNFVVGAGDTYAVDANGGAINHTHGFTGDGHDHELGLGIGLTGGENFETVTSVEPAVGTTDNGSSLPPYYALAYIMKT